MIQLTGETSHSSPRAVPPTPTETYADRVLDEKIFQERQKQNLF